MTTLFTQIEQFKPAADDVVDAVSSSMSNNHSSASSSITSSNQLLSDHSNLHDSLMAQLQNEQIILDNQVICTTDDSVITSNGNLSSSNVTSRDLSSSMQSSSTGDGHHNINSSDDISSSAVSSTTSGRTSSSSVSGTDMDRLARDLSNTNFNTAPKFIKDTTCYWYKPDISRRQALLMLRDKAPGSFVVRDSRFFPGAFGLALKVHQVPPAVLATAEPGTDMNDELIRHYLIEPSTRGVRLKGCANEPVFGSLSALIYQHSITAIALPCKLIIPAYNMEIMQIGDSGPATPVEVSQSAAELLEQGAACNVLFIGSADTESLTGPEAIERAMRETRQANGENVKTSVVQFKVSAQGITLTDNARKIFFRRNYPVSALTYCGMDPSAREPHNRRWDASKQKGPREARVFGFVARKMGSSIENACHLFAELDLEQPATAIVNFVSKVLIGSQQQQTR